MRTGLRVQSQLLGACRPAPQSNVLMAQCQDPGSLPGKGSVQTRPQVVVTGQGGQRAGSVAVSLVQEGCEGCVHPLGTLRTSKLLRLKHLDTEGEKCGSSVVART